MGTRIEDEPPEYGTGPESIDRTPIWKQFLLTGLFLVIALVLVGAAAFAVAPKLVTPPALLVGDRLVLPLSALPPADIGGAGALPTRVGPPLIDEARAFLLGRVGRTEVVAVRALWSPGAGQPECPVHESTGPSPTGAPPDEAPSASLRPPPESPRVGYVAFCERTHRLYWFDLSGNSQDGASRGLDRYLVSVNTDRVIVNLDRLIVSPERTSAPRTP